MEIDNVVSVRGCVCVPSLTHIHTLSLALTTTNTHTPSQAPACDVATAETDDLVDVPVQVQDLR